MKRMALMVGAWALVGASGCSAKPDDGSGRFTDGIPQKSDVALGVPGSSSGTTTAQATTTESGGSGLHLSNVPSGTSYATYYQWTRNVTDGVDFATGWVLGVVWTIVHTPPTSVQAHSAVWGPGNWDSLSPVVWRFTVTEVAPDSYDYELDGRPKGSTSEGDFKAVLTGHGYGKPSPQYRTGWFLIDNDASHALDPTRDQSSGTAKVTYDLQKLPATIDVDVEAAPTKFVIAVTHEAGGAGEVDVTAHADVEQVKDGNLEDTVLKSRWDQSGAGRGDAKVSGGDIPTTLPNRTVTASECWSSTFQRVYYTDSVNYQPTEGNPAACAFPTSAL
jgi:hypothetical protein